jgi:hypothetical protein
MEKIMGQKRTENDRKKVIELAIDVLLRLKNGKIFPGHRYFESRYCYSEKDTEIQKLIEEDAYCEVCALGSMFVCEIAKNNNFKTTDLNITNFAKRLQEILTPEQIILIEIAYESTNDSFLLNDTISEYIEICYENYMNIQEKIRKAKIYGYSIKDDKERMMAIMNNIIENDGEFIP